MVKLPVYKVILYFLPSNREGGVAHKHDFWKSRKALHVLLFCIPRRHCCIICLFIPNPTWPFFLTSRRKVGSCGFLRCNINFIRYLRIIRSESWSCSLPGCPSKHPLLTFRLISWRLINEIFGALISAVTYARYAMHQFCSRIHYIATMGGCLVIYHGVRTSEMTLRSWGIV